MRKSSRTGISILLVLFLAVSVYACKEESSIAQSEDWSGRKLVVMVEQLSEDLVIGDVETQEILWRWSANATSIPSEHKRWFVNPSDVKSVYNGKYLIMSASEGAVALIRIADKKLMFYGNAGKNPHSVELLPDGNIVAASSQDNRMVTFRTDTISGYGTPVGVYELCSGHNVVWDRKRCVLYATSCETLRSYEYNYDRQDPRLLNMKELVRVTDGGSHDLFPVYGKDELYWTTTNYIWKYDLVTGLLSKWKTIFDIKSISDGPVDQGYQTIYLQPTISWYSDRMINDLGKKVFQSNGFQIYKGRWILNNLFSYPEVHTIGKSW